jgi:glutaminyl-peptide cyclotransferase
MKRLSSLLIIGFMMALALGAMAVAPVQSYTIVHSYPHDRHAFTQGLVFYQGFLYEGTGELGHSTIRKVNLETGQVLQDHALPADFFGEGIAIVGGKLYELTWQNKLAMVYDLKTFQLLQRFTYDTEGWGLTTDGKRLIMSDGTSTLFLRDPETFAQTGKLQVTDQGQAVDQLNELEWISGEIYANVWKTDRIVRISPKDGHVLGWIDLKGLLKPEDRQGIDVLNGIAYDAATKRLFVTGKWWPKLFEIALK